ncbi:MAG: 2'-5' RNA ligase family protein [Bryobacterales bacterium]|nr:2'-5' RNA ligase family protein [Bryobacterales bacterium]
MAYIPDPLGVFLDDLRRELVPGCNPHAHVTLLPPRPIQGTAEEAVRHIRDTIAGLPAFDLHAAQINVFPVTNVIFIELGMGRSQMVDLHGILNNGAVAYNEPFEYHPHITLAQEIPADRVESILAGARRKWDEFRNTRIFPVQELTFVQNTKDNCWLDLATVHLEREPIPVGRK